MSSPYTPREIRLAADKFLDRNCLWRNQCAVFRKFMADHPSGKASPEEIEKWSKVTGEDPRKVNALVEELSGVECKAMALALLDVREDVTSADLRRAVSEALSMVHHKGVSDPDHDKEDMTSPLRLCGFCHADSCLGDCRGH